MDKEQMEQQFLSRYDSIIQSGDTRKMERLGAMVKRVMGWMFRFEPQVAAQALALLDEDTATDCPPHFNHYALLTTMLAKQSDEGESLKEAIHANDRDERLLRLVYKLAVNRLEDKDGRFRIRKYFGLER